MLFKHWFYKAKDTDGFVDGDCCFTQIDLFVFFQEMVFIVKKFPIQAFDNRRAAVVGMQRKQRSQAYQQLV